MKIFYIDIEKFKEKCDKSVLNSYADRDFKTEKRYYEYAIGRYLVKNVSKNVYGYSDLVIKVDEKGKPYFENTKLCFSLSHSKKYVVACFDDEQCGVDIEFIKQRDITKFSKYFHRGFDNLHDFYRFWTKKEAEYKLNSFVRYEYTSLFKNEYVVTAVSSSNKTITPEIIEYNDF